MASISSVYYSQVDGIGYDVDPASTLTPNPKMVAGRTFLLAAGTATVDPLRFASGVNMTTTVAGATEYDGKALYFSHVAAARGVVTTEQFVLNSSDFTLSAASGAQALFPAANDTLTVAAATTYDFEALIYLTTGATTHT